MAVELVSWRKQPGDTSNQYQVDVFADDKTDVVPGMKVRNMPSDWEIQPASTARTALGEKANFKSDGTWEWEKTLADVGTLYTEGHTVYLG